MRLVLAALASSLAACGQSEQAQEQTAGDAAPAGLGMIAVAHAAVPEPTPIGSTAIDVGTLENIEELSLAFRPQPEASRVGYYGIGEAASPEQIAGWDIDIRPDGKGLPPGSGTPEQGEPLYEAKCSACHGVFGEGAGRWPKLAGDEPLTGDRPEKTVGNYWPYASTLWDYVHRAMPFYEPQSLSDDETYSIVAYVLYLNDLVEYDFELNQDNLASIEMPNAGGFFIDPRPDVQAAVCMENCKNPDDIRITWDSTELGVTPVEHFKGEGGDATEEIAAAAAPAVAMLDEGAGQRVYQQACRTCHGPGLAGAPVVGDSADWTARASRGIEVVIDHAINGYQGNKGYMPAKGGQSQLSDAEVQAAVRYMLQESGVAE